MFLDWREESERRHTKLLDELFASKKQLVKVVQERDKFVDWWKQITEPDDDDE